MSIIVRVTVLRATHTQFVPAFTSQPQGIIMVLWLVLIAPTHKGMARLS